MLTKLDLIDEQTVNYPHFVIQNLDISNQWVGRCKDFVELHFCNK